MTPQEELQRAEEAARILNEPMLKEAVEIYSETLLAALRQAAIVDDKMREKLLLRFIIVQDVMNELRTIMEGGKLAAKQLEFEAKEKTLKDRFKSYIGF